MIDLCVSRRSFFRSTASLLALLSLDAQTSRPAPRPLDPRGRIHLPIGIPNTLDPLKTFVEAEGIFSPGAGSYGIYFWLYDADKQQLRAPTQEGVTLRYGLQEKSLLIPWSLWTVDGLSVTSELCEVAVPSPEGECLVVGVRVKVHHDGSSARRLALYAALRPLGPAGFDVKKLEARTAAGLLLADGHTAMVSATRPSAGGVVPTDSAGDLATSGRTPSEQSASSASGDCSGALRFDFALPPKREQTFQFVCPVLCGRRAARHQWEDWKQNAMVDAAELNPASGGLLQPDPGPAFYRGLKADALFRQAASYWRRLLAGVDIRVPDARWGEAMRVILGHAALSMNEGAADVAVLNYNVFNRDGMYIANIMQKAGLFRFSESILEYFLGHPFNGRAYPEADNPGQILWAMHQHWLLARDQAWLGRVYPSVERIAAMIRYYRTTPEPHWVAMDSLDFGDSLPAEKRRRLEPGRCDGVHPEYTEAFDIAGLRGAAEMADALGKPQQAGDDRKLAAELFDQYHQRFGARLARQYGSYCVQWPCRLYPLRQGAAFEQFRGTGTQQPKSWRYFPLATAHQGLLAGNREAGHGTLAVHLAHEQMQGWYAFDEGGGSGSGTWRSTRTTWTHSKEKPGENLSVAMPHGWAIAEVWLLIRDCLALEDENRLVLFSGVPPEWFRAAEGMAVKGLATHFGPLDLSYRVAGGGAELEIGGPVQPPGGWVVRLPAELKATVSVAGKAIPRETSGDCLLPADARRLRIRF